MLLLVSSLLAAAWCQGAAAAADSLGEPLFLTPMIDAGQIEDAQRAAGVAPMLEGVQSYSGFLTVDKAFDSNLFFWYFPAETNAEDAPVMLWLQGGPGSTSLLGLFAENGPFSCQDGKLHRRQYSWTRNYHMLYIDNPVGTGYSFTKNMDGYARNQSQVSKNLYSAVSQFFHLFPNLQGRPLFLSGESYAGKYIPSLGYAIHTNNMWVKRASERINLQGLIIGNGWIDPKNMMKFSNYLYQLGLVDRSGRDQMAKMEQSIVTLIENELYSEAFEVFDATLIRYLWPYPTLFKNLTGFDYYYNHWYNTMPPHLDDALAFVQTPAVRQALHVGNSTWHTDMKVVQNLYDDILQSTAPLVAELLQHYNVLIHNGQMDILVGFPHTDNFLHELEWPGREVYLKAERRPWYSDGDLAGYVKKAGRLTQALVRNAGHMVPYDQPSWAFNLIHEFVANKL